MNQPALIGLIAFVFLALLIKDTAPLGDQYILRGLSQGLSLIVGSAWLLAYGRTVEWRKYRVLVLFVIVIGLSALGSHDPVYSILQVASLSACLLLFIGFNECSLSDLDRNAGIVKIILVVGVVIMVMSLLTIKLWPDLAYEYNPYERNFRFRGLFGEPPAMAVTAGMIFGLAYFGMVRWWIKVPALLFSVLCLALTMTRTAWGAWLAAFAIVLWWHTKRKPLMVGVLGFVAVVGAVTMLGFDMGPSEKTLQKTFRTSTLQTLSGRIYIWQYALKFFRERPLLGYGFTTGDDPFKGPTGTLTSTALASSARSAIETQRYTLHNGYIQALMDAGLLGAGFYLALLGQAAYNILRNRRKELAPALYILMFVAVANIGQSVMFSASVFKSLLAWYFVVFALSLNGRVSQPRSDLSSFRQAVEQRSSSILQKEPYGILQPK